MAYCVLLTGGAGFIGSHTAVELLQSGYDVVIADDLSNCTEDVVTRIGRITGRAPAFHRVDVADRAALEEVFEQYDFDAVIHFAGFKAVGESVKQPLKYYRNNLDTTLTLLETMAYHGVNTIVFSSSATVYGVPERVPLTEDMPTGCTNPYGWTKYMIEQILRDQAAAHPELSVVLLRYFNPIGAHPSGLIGELPQGIPNNLLPYVSSVASGRLEKLHVFGDDYPTPDGTGVRDYIHVVDLARGHLAALRYAAAHPGAEVFNLGTGRGYSVLDIVRAFEAANHVSVPYVIDPRRPGDVAECYAATEKAEKLLGWYAEKTLEEMCRDAWRWETSLS
ncbi:MAG: UDP-glucose 4-epimerase GalE [Clostridiales bacterium]|nr:UDP-glucose 4-epimerase GalE [Clostridiales bacterium]